jgi:hypothetical protein
LREKFRQIPLPAGLREQIISEQAAAARAASRRQKLVGMAAVAAILVSIAVLVFMYLPHNEAPQTIPNNLATYLSQMAGNALNSYYMHAATNSDQVRSYLAQYQAPADYVLPAGLQKVALSGCAIENWQTAKASMICFQTGPLPAGQQSDLWLFVIDCRAVKDASAITSRQFAQAGGLTAAVWTQDGKLYVLGTKGDEQTLQKFL